VRKQFDCENVDVIGRKLLPWYFICSASGC